jgi:hypothetical protein
MIGSSTHITITLDFLGKVNLTWGSYDFFKIKYEILYKLIKRPDYFSKEKEINVEDRMYIVYSKKS